MALHAQAKCVWAPSGTEARGRKREILLREPDAGKPHVRFDEREVETEQGRAREAPADERAGRIGPPKPPRHFSTLLFFKARTCPSATRCPHAASLQAHGIDGIVRVAAMQERPHQSCTVRSHLIVKFGIRHLFHLPEAARKEVSMKPFRPLAAAFVILAIAAELPLRPNPRFPRPSPTP